MANAHVCWGHTKFGQLEDKSLDDLIIEVVEEAIDHAGIQASEVDAIFPGRFNSGMIGATGLSMHVMATRRLGEMQKQGASPGRVFNVGGSGVANYCSILEPLRFVP